MKRLNTQAVRIEMLIPENMDASELLERMQALAIEWAEEFADDSSEEDEEICKVEGYEEWLTPEVEDEELENSVSVEIVSKKAIAA